VTNFRPQVALIMRSYNDAAVIRRTLEMLKKQTYRNMTLWNFDSCSSDGTLDIIRKYNAPERIRLNDSANYNPGRVLNEAVNIATAEVFVFLNSDATPVDEYWLEHLIKPLARPSVAATFGRQTPRSDCRSLFVKDTERAFGNGSIAAQWLHFFSMANAAVRADIMEQYPFETAIQYSEDIEWSYRMRLDEHQIVYVPEANATHSHNYTLKQSYRRHRGEGMAEAWIFRRGELNQSFLRYCLLPLGKEVLRDMSWAIQHRSADALTHSLPLRVAQKWGRWQGLRQEIST
jgi:rhamnosyltransferase